MKKPCKRRDSSGDLRDYCKEGRWQASREQVKNRVERNRANRELLPGRDPKGVEVGHKRALSRGGAHAPSNRRIESIHRNRTAGARSH